MSMCVFNKRESVKSHRQHYFILGNEWNSAVTHIHSLEVFFPRGNEGEKKEWMSLRAGLDNMVKRKTFDISENRTPLFRSPCP
jgi:hypothetical protein